MRVVWGRVEERGGTGLPSLVNVKVRDALLMFKNERRGRATRIAAEICARPPIIQGASMKVLARDTLRSGLLYFSADGAGIT